MTLGVPEDGEPHELEGILPYEDSAELLYHEQRPAVVFDNGSLHTSDIDALRDAGYQIYCVLDHRAHTRSPKGALYIFEKIEC